MYSNNFHVNPIVLTVFFDPIMPHSVFLYCKLINKVSYKKNIFSIFSIKDNQFVLIFTIVQQVDLAYEHVDTYTLLVINT